MARRAAIPPWKEALTSHLCWPNCKHKGSLDQHFKDGTWMEDQKEDPTSVGLPHQGYPTPSKWNRLEIRMEGPPSVKPTYAYHFNLLASHLDSSNVRMSPLQTGPFTLHMVKWLLSAKNSMPTEVPHPQHQINLPCWLSCKWYGTAEHYTSM